MIKFQGPIKTARDVARFCDALVVERLRVHPDTPSVEINLDFGSKADANRARKFIEQCKAVPGVDFDEEAAAALIRFGTSAFTDIARSQRLHRKRR